MGAYTKDEFLKGLVATGATTLAKFKARLPSMRSELDKSDTFAQVYRYTYGFACEEGKRIMPLDTACVLWGILFSGAQAWKFTEDWTEFLQAHHKRPVIEDTWSLLLDFRRVRYTALPGSDSLNLG
jgi:DCN1-like protein 1/2